MSGGDALGTHAKEGRPLAAPINQALYPREASQARPKENYKGIGDDTLVNSHPAKCTGAGIMLTGQATTPPYSLLALGRLGFGRLVLAAVTGGA